MAVRKIKKVISALNKASKKHAAQAKTLGSIVKNKKPKGDSPFL